MSARALALALGAFAWAVSAAPAAPAPWAALAAGRAEVSPFVMTLLPGARVPGAAGEARLVYAPSPFGVALTADGHEIYDLRVTARDLPAPASLGGYTTFLAWAASPDLSHWVRLGPVANGTSTVGPVQLDKFLLVIAAAALPGDSSHAGPVVLHGTSPSGWLQKFITHPLFRGIPF